MYRFIIVEDDPMVASIHQSYFRSFPQFDLKGVFSNGKEAMLYLEEHPADLAVVDYYMPEMNGLMFLRQLREQKLQTSVIMITAADDVDTFREIMQYGILDYIVKPFTRERFSLALDKFLRTREKLRSAEKLSQKEIDEIIHAGKNRDSAAAQIPKGIQENTLKMLREYLLEHQDAYFSSNDVAAALNLSRITVRRYMNYLLKNNEVSSRIDYNTGGRPSIMYRFQQ